MWCSSWDFWCLMMCQFGSVEDCCADKFILLRTGTVWWSANKGTDRILIRCTAQQRDEWRTNFVLYCTKYSTYMYCTPPFLIVTLFTAPRPPPLHVKSPREGASRRPPHEEVSSYSTRTVHTGRVSRRFCTVTGTHVYGTIAVAMVRDKLFPYFYSTTTSSYYSLVVERAERKNKWCRIILSLSLH